MHKLWRLAILVALITASCRIEANLDLAIEDDGSGTYTAEVGLDEELQQALAAIGDPDEILSALDFGVPDASTSERIEGDMTYSVVTATFDDASELTEMIREGVDGNPFERFDITVDDEGARVDAAVQLPEGLTSTIAGAEDLPANLEAAVTIQIAMPGRVVSSNADRTIGTNELVWDIDFTDTEVVIEAESTFQEDGFPFWIIALVLLVAAALVAWWLWSKRQEETAIARIEAAGDSSGA
jgi:hypothetical protein